MVYRNRQSYSTSASAPFATTIPATTQRISQNVVTTAPQRITHQKFEQSQLARNKQAETVNTLLKYHDTNKLLSTNNTADARVESLRRSKRLQHLHNEIEFSSKYEESELKRQREQLEREQNEQIANVLQKLKIEQQSEQLNKQRILDSNPEIQQLRANLKAAEVNSIRSQQLEEKEIIKRKEEERNRLEDQCIEELRQKAESEQFDDSSQRLAAALESKEILRQQMLEREKAKRDAYEQFLREKAKIDEIVNSLAQEDELTKQRQLAKQRELQDNIHLYLQERAKWREQEKERTRIELQKIHEYQELQRQRQEQILSEQRKKQEIRDDILSRITSELQAKRKEEEEMEQLLSELYAEEAEERAMLELQEREEKILKLRFEMQQWKKEQEIYKQNLLKQQQIEEDNFRNELMEKFKRDAQIEQMNQLRRKREMQEYKLQVDKLVEEKKLLKQKQIDEELKQRQIEKEKQLNELDIIEQERERLLSQLRQNETIKTYLPKGTIKNEEEYKLLYGKQPVNESKNQITSNNYSKYLPSNSFKYQSSIQFR